MLRFFLITLILLFPGLSGQTTSWQQALTDKSDQLDLYWYESRPFIYPNAQGDLIGIEVEIMEAFRAFLKQRRDMEVTLNWKEADNFYGVLETIRTTEQTNAFGVSAFSITEERKKFVKYTGSYLPDITVLVSSQGTPIVRSFEEINDMMSGMTAITIRGTIYETQLLDLQDKLKIEFNIRYIDSDQNVLDHLSQTPNSFGFIDLPIYLMWIRNGSELVRQNFFTLQGTGYGMIMPLHSGWDAPFADFLADPVAKQQIAEIISRHIGPELYAFIGTLYEGELLGTSILTKEKEIQLALIQNANLRLEEERKFKQLLIFGISLCIALLAVIAFFFYRNQQFTKLVMRQKEQIEAQQEDIHRKNDQLLNRNTKLIAVNEEKNNLINILAHDLRSPLSQIVGMSGMLKAAKPRLSERETEQMELIRNAAGRMGDLVSKILSPEVLGGQQNLVIKEAVDVRQLMEDVVIRYRPAAKQKAIDFKVSVCQEHYILETDYLLLFLILENLVSNAVKFSSSGTIVYLESVCSREEVLFKVRDQGPGFTDDDRLMLFHRFQKLSARPTGDESSTGLGLSIVKKYVTDLGGTIRLESKVGEGSTFFVSFKR